MSISSTQKRKTMGIIGIALVCSTSILVYFLAFYPPSQKKKELGDYYPYFDIPLQAHIESLPNFDLSESFMNTTQIALGVDLSAETRAPYNFVLEGEILYFQFICFQKYLPEEADFHFSIRRMPSKIQLNFSMIPKPKDLDEYCTCLWEYRMEGWITGISKDITEIEFLDHNQTLLEIDRYEL
ncbi:hypothetical protein NEF87_004959 [Candidatus Lokiarchaeum ossiferum]|uniref:Uncharacterized protein n=1 Tax=Candidatus Lokiarchaeum ossiferum TaxID=2951803 RepID=A0ABY6I1V6_9ARCH|nr:hypothetical protein NEF87_004959 [Candidatus Lokiarchaeum sp. B-35]